MKKVIYSCIIIYFLINSTFLFASEADIKYFKENPIEFYQFRATTQLDKNQIKNRDFYKVISQKDIIAVIEQYKNARPVQFVKFEYTNTGNLCRLLYFNQVGKMTSYAQLYYKKNKLSTVGLFDNEGKPILDKNVFYLSYSYDKDGNVKQARYLNAEKKISEDKNGVAVIGYQYGKNNQVIKETHYDKSGSPVTKSPTVIKYTFDDNGNIIKTNHFDKFNKSASNEDGFSIIENKYDKNDHVIEAKYFGIDGKLFSKGIAVVTCNYSDKGLLTEKSFYDSAMNLTEDANKVSIYQWKYDKNNNPVEISYFGKDKRPIEYNGASKIEISYDNNGNEKIRTLYNAKNSIVKKVELKSPEETQYSVPKKFWLNNLPTTAISSVSDDKKEASSKKVDPSNLKDPVNVVDVYLNAWKTKDYDTMFLLSSSKAINDFNNTYNKGRKITKTESPFKAFVETMNSSSVFLTDYSIINSKKVDKEKYEVQVKMTVYYGYFMNELSRTVLVTLENGYWKILQ